MSKVQDVIHAEQGTDVALAMKPGHCEEPFGETAPPATSRAQEAPRWVRWAVLSGIVGLIFWGGWRFQQQSQPRAHKVRGVIAQLDAAASTVHVTFVHPRDGKEHEISGIVTQATRITVAGQEAGFADLAVGQPIKAEGLVFSDGRIEAMNITVEPASLAGGA